MEHKEILALFSRECAPGDEKIVGFLRDSLATFSVNRPAAINRFQQLQASDLLGFILAAVQLLASTEEESPGWRYIAGLLFAGNLLIDLLLDERVLALDVVIPLARNLAAVEPRLGVRLVQRLFAKAEGDAAAIDTSAALRALELVDAISDCSHVAPYMVQLMHHPSAHVQSKATLLLGRANLNLARVGVFLASEDSRVSANAVESLRGRREKGVREMLWKATRSPHGRAVVNALLELYRWGDREAYAQLVELAGGTDPVLRSGAAWAMGESGDPEFGELLEKLGQDSDAKVRAMAEKSRGKLRQPGPSLDGGQPGRVAG